MVPMRTWFLGLTWALILGVAYYDMYFAWHYRAVFNSWEINPLVRLVASQFGLSAIFGLRVVTVAFAALVAVVCCGCRRPRTALVYTACVGGIHLVLGLHYLVGHVQSWMNRS
jgi:hypothetical protein